MSLYFKITVAALLLCSDIDSSQNYDNFQFPSTFEYDLSDLICNTPNLFDSFESLKQHGFEIVNEAASINSWSIMVARHPQLKGFLIKKYRDSIPRDVQLRNYLLRIKNACILSDFINMQKMTHLIVPKKWLYVFSTTGSDSEDYLLIVEELPICSGGWWGGETLQRYAVMDEPTMREICFVLYNLQGCDAWPQNLPFTRNGQIAFIDTEHLGQSFGDFTLRLLQFINPKIVPNAQEYWSELERFQNQEN